MRYAERGMRTTLTLTLLSCVALAGCSGKSAKKLEGRWHGVKATGVAADQVGAANLFASTLELDFHGDRVSVLLGNDKQTTRFKVVQDDKKSVVLDADAARETFTFVDDKTMSWTVAPGQTIQFVKE